MPDTRPAPEWLPRAAAGLALCAALAGVGFLLSQRGSSARGPASTGASAGGASTSRAPLAPSAVTPGASRTAGLLPKPAKPLPSSRPPPAPFDPAAKRPTLAEAMDGLRAALASGDPDAIGGAEARLRAFVSGDEGRALELLEAFKGESDPAMLALIAGVLASDPVAAASTAVAAAMASIAEDPAAPQARREQALALLAQSTAAVPDLERRLQALARSPEPELRQGALAALASRAQALPAGQGGREATVALLRAVQAEQDPEVRSSFLAAVPLRDAPAEAVGDVRSALRTDPSAAVREAAAHALGDVPGRDRRDTAAALEEAFRAESDPGTRRAILISLVRLLGGGAQEPIARLRPLAGAAQVDCDDYLAILASGETQADRIFEQKIAREIARGGPDVGPHDGGD